MAQFSKDVSSGGLGMLEKMKAAPADSLHAANYTQIFENPELKFVPPQADWMLM